MVSDTPTDGRCNAEIGGGYCEGWQMDNGRCHKHGGRNDGDERDAGGAPENNTNSVTHGLYADENQFYMQTMSDKQRNLCDEIFQDYCTDFRDKNGEPHTGEQARLFEIAVNHIKIIYSDNWLNNKPSDLDSGNPLVDKSQRYNTEGVPYEEYKASVVTETQQKLRNADRQWLKDMNLLDDAEHAKAEAVGDATALWMEELSE